MSRDASNREDGTVLLSTLLVLALMSAVALGLLATVRTAITRATSLEAQAQTDLYAQGARDFVQLQLDQFRSVEGSQLNAALATAEPALLPFDNGNIELRIADGTQCMRLSALTDTNGEAQDTEQLIFAALMTALGVDGSRAERIAASIMDWVDADSQTRSLGAEDGVYLSRSDTQGGPHRTANTALQSVTELRSIDGMDEALFQQLLPYLCIGTVGAPTVFNIDGAQLWQAPVLAALLGSDPEAFQLATSLIEGRPSSGYGSSEALLASPILEGFDTAGTQLASIVFAPQRITAETLIRYSGVETAQFLAYEGVDTGRPTLTYRSDGWDEFPSLALARLDNQAGLNEEDAER
ncbi:type II secretion system minor pseudopilin GspK [Algimonas porphyrae]|uniref:T2SS protein K first SAM-like domain-containing protein n=1 Tax=Algimonas porphyrae TaxID=1128113 RepID=A0ABQ5V2F2_9PROT|nr:type II secretion system minor pseudopilin GspK [Algimonas porphyrae]GLQ21661.1 hypothetical protein GCM10007854_26160 [Algimonas porphyrae]